jgi:hypothetical protein
MGAVMKICRENPDLAKIGQKYRTLYVKTEVRFRVDSHCTARHDNDMTRQKPACIRIYRQLTDRQNILFSQSQRHCLRR